MRIHRLRLAAIGPYPGTHDIDFERLSVSGLFLLAGPTGSGKSTIIDAITYALYGSTVDTKERLHSGHADPLVEPFVELTFSTSAGTYRVWRSPEYPRPKQRGEGFTLQNTQTKLFRLTSEDQIGVDGAGEPISAQVGEASAKILELIQLDRDQFLQTIVLPQGKFASFLHSKPDDRRQVLQTIFATRVYEATQEDLRKKAAEAQARVAELRRDVAAALRHLWGERPDVPEIGTKSWEDPAPFREQGAALVRASADLAAETQQQSRVATAAVEAKQGDLDAARVLTILLQRRTEALKKLADLEDRASEIAAATVQLAQATSALGLRSQLEQADHLARAAADAVAALEAARRDAPELGALSDVERTHERTRRASAVEQLRAAQQREQERSQKASHLTDLNSQKVAAEHTRTQKQDLLRAVPAQLAKVTNLQMAAASAVGRLAGLESRVDTLKNLDRVAVKAADTTRQLADATERAKLARTVAEQAFDAEAAARHAWLDGIAGELAQDLGPEIPCPVCGSQEHPAPAARVQGGSREAMEAAGAARTAADRDAAAAVTRTKELSATLEELEGQLEGQDAHSIAADLAAARDSLSSERALAEQAAPLAAELERLQSQESALEAEIGALNGQIETHAHAMSVLEGELNAIDRELTTARGSHASISAALESAGASLAQLDDFDAAASAAATAQRDAALAQQTLEAALPDAGFLDAVAARAALLPSAAFDQLKQRVKADADLRSAAESTLAEPEIAALTGMETPNVEALAAEVEALAAQATSAANQAGAAERDARRDSENLAALDRAIGEEAALSGSVGALVRMSMVAQGDNLPRMKLATYVLLSRFESVINAANIRLRNISEGRFELRRTNDEGGQLTRSQGLGLEIMDFTTNTARSPRSLSGGETFYTSLALALGLADVVVKSTEVVYRLVILRLLGQAVRAGSSGWATTSSGVCGSPTRRAAARASSPR